jgi:hypothetical protein
MPPEPPLLLASETFLLRVAFDDDAEPFGKGVDHSTKS